MSPARMCAKLPVCILPCCSPWNYIHIDTFGHNFANCTIPNLTVISFNGETTHYLAGGFYLKFHNFLYTFFFFKWFIWLWHCIMCKFQWVKENKECAIRWKNSLCHHHFSKFLIIAQSVEYLAAWCHPVSSGMTGPSFKPHQCLLVGTWKGMAWLPCWPPRDQQVSHQRWTLGNV